MVKPELFFDRKKELVDAYVTCEQILNGGVGGILVIGGRGIGKTSFLDALGRLLREKNIANAKIALDETMVKEENEIAFIQLMLTELLEASRKSGLLEEKITDKVVNMLRGLDVEGEMDISLPGLNFIAKASREKLSPKFSSIVLRDGLLDYVKLIEQKGRKETRKGAFLMFDEGDCLTLNKSLLQIFKNVFQNMPKIGIVIAGSTRLTGQVSDVFSPLPRFFMKIELGPYPDDSTAFEAIRKPIEVARSLLHKEGFEFDVVHGTFDKIVIQTTGRMPLEINLLCHFAFDIGAQNFKFEANRITLYFKFDKKLLDEAYKQLVGTRGYNDFIRELSESEVNLMRLLSKSSSKATIEEMTLLLRLDICENSLQELPVSKVVCIMKEYKKEIPKVSPLIDSIIQKGDKYKIGVLGSTLVGKTLFEVEDQWVRSYFKYGWREEDVDIELGIKPKFGGIRVFGDPIASIMHSIFFPRISEFTGTHPAQSFRAHVGTDSGQWLQPQRNNELLVASYIRLANDFMGHYAINLKKPYDATTLKREFDEVLEALKELGIIEKPDTMLIK